MTSNAIQELRRSSNLGKSNLCFEEFNATYIVSWMDRGITTEDVHNFLASLEDPCTKISYYNYNLQKVVQWKGDRSKIKDFDRDRDHENMYVEFEELLESFYMGEKFNESFNTTTTTMRQTLIIDHQSYFSKKMRKTIELLENETKWNVIVVCLSNKCPIITRLPINRMIILPTVLHDVGTIEGEEYRSIQKNIKDLIRNPDFNEFEFIKYIKIDDKNLTCLANKNVHIYSNFFTRGLLEMIALIKYNIPKDSTKFIIYLDNGEEFPPYFLKKHGLSNIISIVELDSFSGFNFPKLTKDGILFFNMHYPVLRHFENYSSSGNFNNSVVVYELEIRGKFYNITNRAWTEPRLNSFKKTLRRISFKKIKVFTEIQDYFLEELLKASCY